MKPDYRAFFESYVGAFNEALRGNTDTRKIRSFFSKKFLAAGPGSVATGRNGLLFSIVLKSGYKFYRKIGTKRLMLKDLSVVEIDPNHDMAKVFYRADYEKKDGQIISIDFDVTYLLEYQSANPRIFAFVAGDEKQAFKDAGLI